jgi:plasmid stabilization system protein ParE
LVQQRNSVVAQRLIDETQKTMRLAATDPLRFPLAFGIYRRIRIPGFRYALYFKVQNDTVTILALIHGARHVESFLANRDSVEEP